jgi:hypothetical protein
MIYNLEKLSDKDLGDIISYLTNIHRMIIQRDLKDVERNVYNKTIEEQNLILDELTRRKLLTKRKFYKFPTKQSHSTKLEDLNFGYKVKVIKGNDKGRTGYVLYPMSNGEVAISTKEPPEKLYNLREKPNNLEIISKENIHKIGVNSKLSFKTNCDLI